MSNKNEIWELIFRSQGKAKGKGTAKEKKGKGKWEWEFENENLNGNNIANKRRGEEVQVNTCRQIDGFWTGNELNEDLCTPQKLNFDRKRR